MIPDNYDLWEQHEIEQQKWEESRPICSCCDEHIQDEVYYEIHGKKLCVSCIEEMKVRIE